MGSPAPTKDDAQRRADQIRAFRAEVAALSREGLDALSADRASAVAAHHDALLESLAAQFDIDPTEATRRLSLGMRVASAFGAAALTAAVVAFCYRIWGDLSTPAQIVLLTSAPVVALAAMIFAARRERTLYVASLCGIVACGAFVLQTVMLGDLFNLHPSAHVFASWAAFALAVALPYRLAIPFAWGVACLIAYPASLGMSLAGAPFDELVGRPETLVVPALVAYYAWRWAPVELRPWSRGVALTIALGALLMLAVSRPDSLLPWSTRTAGYVYQLLAALAAVVVIARGVRTGRSETLVIGALFGAFFLLGRFVAWWWEWMPKYLFFLLVAATCLAWLWMLGRLRRRAVAGLR